MALTRKFVWAHQSARVSGEMGGNTSLHWMEGRHFVKSRWWASLLFTLVARGGQGKL